jgi:YD repeat-containing protein
VQAIRSDGHVIAIHYDPNGNVIAITPPQKRAHARSYTPADALASYTPPAAGQGTASSTVYDYTPDRKLKRVRLPDGRFIENGYRADGKLQTVTTPLGTSSYTYNPATGGLGSITDPMGGTWLPPGGPLVPELMGSGGCCEHSQ